MKAGIQSGIIWTFTYLIRGWTSNLIDENRKMVLEIIENLSKKKPIEEKTRM